MHREAALVLVLFVVKISQLASGQQGVCENLLRSRRADGGSLRSFLHRQLQQALPGVPLSEDIFRCLLGQLGRWPAPELSTAMDHLIRLAEAQRFPVFGSGGPSQAQVVLLLWLPPAVPPAQAQRSRTAARLLLSRAMPTHLVHSYEALLQQARRSTAVRIVAQSLTEHVFDCHRPTPSEKELSNLPVPVLRNVLPILSYLASLRSCPPLGKLWGPSRGVVAASWSGDISPHIVLDQGNQVEVLLDEGYPKLLSLQQNDAADYARARTLEKLRAYNDMLHFIKESMNNSTLSSLSIQLLLKIGIDLAGSCQPPKSSVLLLQNILSQLVHHQVATKEDHRILSQLLSVFQHRQECTKVGIRDLVNAHDYLVPQLLEDFRKSVLFESPGVRAYLVTELAVYAKIAYQLPPDRRAALLGVATALLTISWPPGKVLDLLIDSASLLQVSHVSLQLAHKMIPALMLIHTRPYYEWLSQERKTYLYMTLLRLIEELDGMDETMLTAIEGVMASTCDKLNLVSVLFRMLRAPTISSKVFSYIECLILYLLKVQPGLTINIQTVILPTMTTGPCHPSKNITTEGTTAISTTETTTLTQTGSTVTMESPETTPSSITSPETTRTSPETITATPITKTTTSIQTSSELSTATYTESKTKIPTTPSEEAPTEAPSTLPKETPTATPSIETTPFTGNPTMTEFSRATTSSATSSEVTPTETPSPTVSTSTLTPTATSSKERTVETPWGSTSTTITATSPPMSEKTPIPTVSPTATPSVVTPPQTTTSVETPTGTPSIATPPQTSIGMPTSTSSVVTSSQMSTATPSSQGPTKASMPTATPSETSSVTETPTGTPSLATSSQVSTPTVTPMKPSVETTPRKTSTSIGTPTATPAVETTPGETSTSTETPTATPSVETPGNTSTGMPTGTPSVETTPEKTSTSTGTSTATSLETTPGETSTSTGTLTTTPSVETTPWRTSTEIPTGTPSLKTTAEETSTSTGSPTGTPSVETTPEKTSTSTGMPTATPSVETTPGKTSTGTPTGTPSETISIKTSTGMPTGTPPETTPSKTSTSIGIPTGTSSAETTSGKTSTSTRSPTGTPSVETTSEKTSIEMPTATPSVETTPEKTSTSRGVPTGTPSETTPRKSSSTGTPTGTSSGETTPGKTSTSTGTSPGGTTPGKTSTGTPSIETTPGKTSTTTGTPTATASIETTPGKTSTSTKVPTGTPPVESPGKTSTSTRGPTATPPGANTSKTPPIIGTPTATPSSKTKSTSTETPSGSTTPGNASTGTPTATHSTGSPSQMSSSKGTPTATPSAMSSETPSSSLSATTPITLTPSKTPSVSIRTPTATPSIETPSNGYTFSETTNSTTSPLPSVTHHGTTPPHFDSKGSTPPVETTPLVTVVTTESITEMGTTEITIPTPSQVTRFFTVPLYPPEGVPIRFNIEKISHHITHVNESDSNILEIIQMLFNQTHDKNITLVIKGAENITSQHPEIVIAVEEKVILVIVEALTKAQLTGELEEKTEYLVRELYKILVTGGKFRLEVLQKVLTLEMTGTLKTNILNILINRTINGTVEGVHRVLEILIPYLAVHHVSGISTREFIHLVVQYVQTTNRTQINKDLRHFIIEILEDLINSPQVSENDKRQLKIILETLLRETTTTHTSFAPILTYLKDTRAPLSLDLLLSIQPNWKGISRESFLTVMRLAEVLNTSNGNPLIVGNVVALLLRLVSTNHIPRTKIGPMLSSLHSIVTRTDLIAPHLRLTVLTDCLTLYGNEAFQYLSPAARVTVLNTILALVHEKVDDYVVSQVLNYGWTYKERSDIFVPLLRDVENFNLTVNSLREINQILLVLAAVTANNPTLQKELSTIASKLNSNRPEKSKYPRSVKYIIDSLLNRKPLQVSSIPRGDITVLSYVHWPTLQLLPKQIDSIPKEVEDHDFKIDHLTSELSRDLYFVALDPAVRGNLVVVAMRLLTTDQMTVTLVEKLLGATHQGVALKPTLSTSNKLSLLQDIPVVITRPTIRSLPPERTNFLGKFLHNLIRTMKQLPRPILETLIKFVPNQHAAAYAIQLSSDIAFSLLQHDNVPEQVDLSKQLAKILEDKAESSTERYKVIPLLTDFKNKLSSLTSSHPALAPVVQYIEEILQRLHNEPQKSTNALSDLKNYLQKLPGNVSVDIVHKMLEDFSSWTPADFKALIGLLHAALPRAEHKEPPLTGSLTIVAMRLLRLHNNTDSTEEALVKFVDLMPVNSSLFPEPLKTVLVSDILFVLATKIYKSSESHVNAETLLRMLDEVLHSHMSPATASLESDFIKAVAAFVDNKFVLRLVKRELRVRLANLLQHLDFQHLIIPMEIIVSIDKQLRKEMWTIVRKVHTTTEERSLLQFLQYLKTAHRDEIVRMDNSSMQNLHKVLLPLPPRALHNVITGVDDVLTLNGVIVHKQLAEQLLTIVRIATRSPMFPAKLLPKAKKIMEKLVKDHIQREIFRRRPHLFPLAM